MLSSGRRPSTATASTPHFIITMTTTLNVTETIDCGGVAMRCSVGAITGACLLLLWMISICIDGVCFAFLSHLHSVTNFT